MSNDDILVRALLAQASGETPAKIASDPDVVQALINEWANVEKTMLSSCTTDASVDPSRDPIKNARPFSRSIVFRKGKGIFVAEGIDALHWSEVPTVLLMAGVVYLPKLQKIGRYSEASVQSSLAHISSVSTLMRSNDGQGTVLASGGTEDGVEGVGAVAESDADRGDEVGDPVPTVRKVGAKVGKVASPPDAGEGRPVRKPKVEQSDKRINRRGTNTKGEA